MKNKTKALCPHCMGNLTNKKKHVSPGYSWACLECDEDFYNIEVKIVEEKLSK